MKQLQPDSAVMKKLLEEAPAPMPAIDRGHPAEEEWAKFYQEWWEKVMDLLYPQLTEEGDDERSNE